MKGRIKKIFSSVLCALVVLSFLAQPMCTMAAEIESNVLASKVQQTDMMVNPEYADVLDVEVLQAEQDEIRALTDQVSTFAAGSVHATLDAAAADIREQMVKRNPVITIKITKELFDSMGIEVAFNAPFEAAVEYSEACSGQEGDALEYAYSSRSTSITQGGSSEVTITYTLTYMSTYEQEVKLTKAVNAAISSLDMENDDEYTKVYKIYNYICDNVDYDYENLYDDTYELKYTAYAAMCNGTAVCEGYAVLFYRMCKEVGLSVRFIGGYSNGGAHAWNIVRIGDYYYNVDCTWDGQDATTYDNFFLKNMAGFGDHTRDSEFTTAEFMTKYPMSSLSWTDFDAEEVGSEKLNAANGSYTYQTIDGATVSSTADGKPKVLIFYVNNCSNSQSIIKAISNANLTGADVVAVNIDRLSLADVKKYKETYGSDKLVFTYDTTYDANRSMLYYTKLAGFSSSMTFPIIVYVDNNNRVQTVTQGYQAIDQLQFNLNYYCGSFELKVGESTKTLNKDDTYKITTYLYGEKFNNAQFKWSTSDAKVATVNTNGVVTAVGGGTCTITGKLSDKYSVNVTINVLQKLDVPQFTVANTSGGVQIKWNFVDGATGYIIYRREANGTFKKIAGFTDGKTKSYVDKTVVNGTTYFYAVKAINSTSQSNYTSKGITYKAMLATPQFTVENASGGVKIKWDFVADATGYIIYRREAGGTFSKIAGFTDGKTKSYLDTSLVDGKAYFYAVKAVNSTSQSAYTTKGINYKAFLATPAFTIANTSSGVQIKWDFVDGAIGYIVYRREAGGTFSKIAGFTDGKTKSYTDTNVVNGKAYFYAVKAVNNTTQSTYETKGLTYKSGLMAPTFTVANVSGGVQIKWEFVDDAIGYIIYKREAGGTFSKLAGFTDGTKSYIDTNVVDGKAYFYAVKAVNNTTQSTYTTQGINYKASLAAPTFTVANVSGGVQVNWNFVTGATGYIVYRRDANGTFQKIAGFTDGKTKSYVDTTAVKGTTYYYAVKAINSSTQSPYNSVQITVK